MYWNIIYYVVLSHVSHRSWFFKFLVHHHPPCPLVSAACRNSTTNMPTPPAMAFGFEVEMRVKFRAQATVPSGFILDIPIDKKALAMSEPLRLAVRSNHEIILDTLDCLVKDCGAVSKRRQTYSRWTATANGSIATGEGYCEY
jgi:hypothetical protein